MKNCSDYGKNVDEWYSNFDETLIPIATELKILIKRVIPKVVKSIKWGTPTYEKNSFV